MKVGDILINRWAGHIDCRYFIYLGTSGDYIKGLEIIQGRPRKVKYYRSSLNEFIRDTNKKALEVVGHTDFLNIAKVDLQKLKDMEEKDNEEYEIEKEKKDAINQKTRETINKSI